LLLVLLVALWGTTTTPSSARPLDQAFVTAISTHEGMPSADDGADRAPLAIGRKVNSELSLRQRRKALRPAAGKDNPASIRLYEAALRQPPASTIWLGDHQQMAFAAFSPCFNSRAPPVAVSV